jgi:5'-nucleotidase
MPTRHSRAKMLRVSNIEINRNSAHPGGVVSISISRTRAALGSRWARAGLVVTAVVAAVVAPLALSSNQTADAVTIGGAQTLSDGVSVNWNNGHHGATTDLHVLAWNDFHGTLEPASQTIYGRFAGGAAYLAKLVNERQASYDRRVATVLAGDNIGASPLANGLFKEEPATIVTNFMNVDFAAVGNHEFDKGKDELVRIQEGGCQATGCTGAPYARPDRRSTSTFPGADYQYLSANVIDDATGEPLFPASGVKWFKGIPGGKKIGLGFIGEVLEATPTIVTPAGVAGLTFIDEAEAANAEAARLAARGVKIPILVIHQGGFQSPGPTAVNGCAGNLAGSDIEEIAKRLDPSIKIIISGHTHAEYRCTITVNGVTRLVTSASSFGRILSDLKLTVDNRSGELVSASAENVIVENALNAAGTGVVRQEDPSKADPTVAAIVKQYVDASAPLANTVIGRIQGDLTRTTSGESTLGDVIADAQLAATESAATGGAAIAFMNPGGIRADLLASAVSSGGEAIGEVTYGEAFTVQPFGNSLVTKTMTGAQVRSLLEQQFVGCGGQANARTLQISHTLSYESHPSATPCAAKIGQVLVNGVALQPTDTLRVTMNSFLATGGDGFTVFNQGTDPLGGDVDIDAFAAYLTAANPAGVAVPTLNRIVVLP